MVVPGEEERQSLTNLLEAYAVLDPEVGYCQGMNFVMALILIATEYNEPESFAIFIRIMLMHNWREVYLPNLLGMLNIGKKVAKWIKKELR